ncbi:hypothetical protein AVEN_237101-1 [Araneus ventricosus]|uniref:Uncharacterized protein n=1 Tax=Araneus ventricosus TaxID=182803 RepID=A0A4Y2LAW6_ARAVE|nr:hypothetical protein AVEN_53005-1 [Araneus ventricosus]GBN11614.1 hypothetical protein AVEN_237101-1 [Araneus ventricosus]
MIHVSMPMMMMAMVMMSMMVGFMVMMSMMGIGMKLNMSWILISGTGFVGLDSGSESVMVSYIVDFPVDTSVVSETITSLNVMAIPVFMSVLRSVVIFDFITEFVGLWMVMMVLQECENFY